MEAVDELLDKVLDGADLRSDFGRIRAYRQCVRYAEEHLAASHQCNLFLYRAAERLGQAPLAIPVVHNRVPLPDDARLCFYYHEEEGPVLVGNAAGLRYLGELSRELADATLPGENVILDEGYPPFVGDSYGLTFYLENEEWFAAAEEGLEEEFVADWEAEVEGRIVNLSQVAAVQFSGHIPSDLAVTAQKLYRILSIDPWPEQQHLPRKPYRVGSDGVRLVHLQDDEGDDLRLGLDLNDPDLTFYYDWHLAQFSGEQD